MDRAFDKANLRPERLSDGAEPTQLPLGGDHGVLQDVQDKPWPGWLRG